jgi:hypothetical protein
MRSASFARSFAFVLQIALLSGAARAAGPDVSDAEKDSEFFVTACQNSINDPAAVGRLAKEQNWSSLVDPDRVDFKPLKIRGMWRVDRDDRTYTLTLGVDLRGITTCFISFGEPRPRRDDFTASAAKFLSLKTEGDGKDHGPGVQFATYRIENLSPAGSMLQIVAMDDLVMSAMIFGPFPETPPPPPK